MLVNQWLGNKIMDATIGLIGTVIGACIAGLFMYFKDKKQYEFGKQKSTKELLLTKYEQIYKDLTAYSAYSTELSMQIMSETGYDGKFDAKKIKTNLSDNHLIMNVMFYAPELLPIMDKVRKKQIEVSRCAAEFILDLKATREKREKLTGDAVIASSELTNLVLEAQKQLSTLVQTQLNA